MIPLLFDELKLLMDKGYGTCISIYMPTHRTGHGTRQDPIRFRNLLRQAEIELIGGGQRTVDARTLLEPARNLQGHSPFWRHLSDGLAIFLARGVFITQRVPVKFDEQVVVAGRFYLKPLLPLLYGDGHYYVLGLSQNKVGLFQASRFGISEVDLEGIPDNLTAALGERQGEKRLQFHTQTGSAPGKRSAIFFGHGNEDDRLKHDLRKFFRMVDKGIGDLLGNDPAPLVLAGLDPSIPIYTEVNSNAHLMKDSIRSHPDELSIEELHQKSWSIVEPYFRKEQTAALARYAQLVNTERISSQVEVIVPAAFYGRVDTLFVALGVQRWGDFDEQSGQIHSHSKARPESQDLLQYAALHTLLNGGTVFALERTHMPGETLLAAIMRS